MTISYRSLLDIFGVTDSLLRLPNLFPPFSSTAPAPPSIPLAGHYDEWRGECETGQRRPSMVCYRDAELIAVTNNLTPAHSIQEALRMYLQPIKNDDPQLDFYTMYK